MKYFPYFIQKMYLPKDVKVVDIGATSIIYAKKGSNKIFGITTDKDKIKWLKFNKKRFDFTLIKKEFSSILGEQLYFYKMKQLKKLNKKDKKFLQKDVFNIVDKLYSTIYFVGINELKCLKKFIYCESIKKEFTLIEKCFGRKSNTLELDFHIGQILKNDRGDYVIIDPVYRQQKG